MKRGKREGLSMDITPLVDVIFILLIFFMVTSVFKTEEVAMLLKLPEVEQTAGKETELKNITIKLNREQLAINEKISSFDELKSYAKGVEDKNAPIELRIDHKVTYDRIVQVLDILQGNKLTNLTLITEK